MRRMYREGNNIDDITRLDCCLIPSAYSLSIVDLQNVDFTNHDAVKCGSGYFVKGFYWEDDELRDITRIRCALPENLDTTLKTTYKQSADHWFGSPRWASDSWMACSSTGLGDYGYMTGFTCPDWPSNNCDDLDDIRNLQCAIPNDLPCNAPPARTGIATTYPNPCDALHQGCEAEQSCAPGYEPTSSVTTGTIICVVADDTVGVWATKSGSQTLNCQDKNECTCTGAGCHDCPAPAVGGKCTNLPGSFECGCVVGWTYNSVSKMCEDNDECGRTCVSEDPLAQTCNDCGPNTQCQNTMGNFECPCLAGYAKNAQQECENVVECLTHCSEQGAVTGRCHDCPLGSIPSICEDTEGSYTCECPAGSVLDQGVCVNVDECQTECTTTGETDCYRCQANEYCWDDVSGNVAYECRCSAGFEKDASDQCVNIDECADPLLHTCAEAALCHDTPGAYECGPYINSLALNGASVTVSSALGTQSPDAMELVVADPYGAGVVVDSDITYGSALFPQDFQCVASSAPAAGAGITTHNCDLVPGAGVNLVFTVSFCWSDGECATASHPALFSYPGPTLIVQSLRLDPNVYDTSPGVGNPCTVASTSEFGELLYMDGTNLYGNLGPQTTVTFGPDGDPAKFGCNVQSLSPHPTLSGVTVLACQTTPGAYGDTLKFRVTVGRGDSAQQSAVGQDIFALPTDSAQMLSIAGCDPDGEGTQNCPTHGGTTLTVTALFAYTPVTLFVNLRVCEYVADSYAPSGQPNTITFQCLLPAGVGLMQPVLLAQNTTRQFTPMRTLVSYAPPSIHSVSIAGCVQVDPLTLVDCPRQGLSTMQIIGENFGENSADLSLGGEAIACDHVFSFSGENPENGLHRHLEATLPAIATGRAQNLTIVVRQANGVSSSERVIVSYKNCPAGSMDADSVCTQCLPGSYSTEEGALTCIPCPRGWYQDQSAQQSCLSCPAGKIQPESGETSCSPCGEGTYSVGRGSIECLECPAGSYNNASNSIDCIPCSPGSHQVLPGQKQCVACLVGSYTNEEGAVVCIECPAGQYNQVNGSQRCDVCSRGYYSNTQGAAQCTKCEVGRYSDSPGTTKCIACLPGRHLNETGQRIPCYQCEEGKFQAESGKVSCDPCPEGQYTSEQASLQCKPCQLGRFRNDSNTCASCQPGTFQDQPGASECQQCPAGFKNSEFEARTCVPCSKGTYQPWNNSLDCILCSNGKATADLAQLACTECQPGKFQGTDGQFLCEKCVAGKFSNSTAAEECTPCPPGRFVEDDGRTECSLCEPGTSSIGDVRECVPCVPGTYAGLRGQVTCGLCPKLADAHEDGTKCLCPVGYFSTTEVVDGLLIYKCHLCPEGSVCEVVGVEADNLKTKVGWWRANNSTQKFWRCQIPRICVGGQSTPTGESPCAPHRVGVLCGVCEEGYRESGSTDDCALCPTKSVAWGMSVAVVVLVLALLCVMYYVVLRLTNAQQKGLVNETRMNDQAELAALTDMLDGVEDGLVENDEDDGMYDDEEDEDETDLERARKKRVRRAQKTGTAGTGDSFRVKPTRPMSSMLYKHHNQAGLEVKDVMKATTLNSRRAPNFMYKTKIMVGFFQVATILSFQGEVNWPRQFAEFISIFNFLNFDFVPWQTLGCATGINFFGKALMAGLIPLAVILLLVLLFYLPMYCYDQSSMQNQLNFEQRRAASYRQFVKLLLFTVFLLYPFVSRIILSVYNCEEILGESYLLADFSLRCGQGEWMTYGPLLAIFVPMYPIGIPLVYFFLLRKHRKSMREPAVILQFGFLYEAYSDDRWYWELLDMGHKLLLTSLVAFAPNYMEMVAAMLILVLYTIMLLTLKPYIRKGDDRMHLLAQTELLLMCMVGWVLQNTEDGQLSGLMEALVSTVLIAITVGFLLTFFLIAGKNVAKLVKLSKKVTTKSTEADVVIDDEEEEEEESNHINDANGDKYGSYHINEDDAKGPPALPAGAPPEVGAGLPALPGGDPDQGGAPPPLPSGAPPEF